VSILVVVVFRVRLRVRIREFDLDFRLLGRRGTGCPLPNIDDFALDLDFRLLVLGRGTRCPRAVSSFGGTGALLSCDASFRRRRTSFDRLLSLSAAPCVDASKRKKRKIQGGVSPAKQLSIPAEVGSIART
jgi:hypothetical protein